jgi:hypothetical protein
MNPVVLAALVFMVVLIVLAWLLVMRLVKDDDIPVRATLDEDGSTGKSPAQRDREQEEHVATNPGLGRAKDHDVAQTWDPEL